MLDHKDSLAPQDKPDLLELLVHQELRVGRASQDHKELQDRLDL
jgi:hypothetical protein